ncbi:carnitine O-palmitoyltransferase 1, liver isoform-like isoform X1 [Lytechinus variegatus]|uniref:carnitine O-palmitoyltransferase 1, liver isoform-like isoform X1 n=2 Tax=Lytechinus variegatus TaxID=7654 RepID=UPI001BB21291|nr:carnitine O-palmitoyltransferase 1, liver isoform-like isoform X1 [Lytechinus variegatus]
MDKNFIPKLVNGYQSPIMAEAHAAVGFQFTVTPEGIDLNVNHEVLKAIFESGKRSWADKFRRFQNHMVTTTYPASPASWVAVLVAIIACLVAKMDPSLGIIDFIKDHLLPLSLLGVMATRSISVLIYVTLLWLFIIYMLRYILKLLLSYRGFMYEAHGKMSWQTKLWLVSLRVFCSRHPKLYSYQASLPNLPLPKLTDTMERYLRSVKGFLSTEEYAEMERLAEEFQSSIGDRLQRYLQLKWLWSTNYVSDWWEEYVYLRGRSPIMVNSNYYGMDGIAIKPTYLQAARAANSTVALLKFRREIDHEVVKPIMVQKAVPLCSQQYERTFNTTRIPGLETDRLIHHKTSNHIVVMSRGRYYKLIIQSNGSIIKPCELEKQYQQILDDPEEPHGEQRLAALTAGDRIPWAAARQRFFMSGVNKSSLAAIETAAFVVVLDEEEHEYDVEPLREFLQNQSIPAWFKGDPFAPKDEGDGKLDKYAASLLHGNCYNRWFDKCFNLIVFKNGHMGVNAEHSLADAPIYSHTFEDAVAEDILFMGYTPEGHTKGESSRVLKPPQRLQWEVPKELEDIIDTSYQVAKKLVDDVQIHVRVHNKFGKGAMKKCKVSPDAFIQLAMQLAYYRDASRFCLTYESSMTRLYREGRTETVRSCTVESCDFVRTMEDPDSTKEEKLAKFRIAANKHVQSYRDAMCGKGVDRHLFCLYVVSKYLNLDSPFLKKVLSEPWRLSTSQTAPSQSGKVNVNKNPGCLSAGGGFGPVADDGYGVSYIIAGENLIFFHVSCKNTAGNTNAIRFGDNIEKALADILAMFNKDN